MSQTAAPGTEWPLPRGLIVLLGAAAAALTIGGIREASEIIGPVFLALVLTVAVHPLRGYLVDSHRWPAWAGTLAAILAAYVVVSSVVLAVAYSLAKFAGLLPQYQEDLTNLVTSATDAWSRAGLPQQQADAVNQSFDPERLVSTVTAVVTGLVGTASSLFFLFVLLLFMAIDATHFPAKLAGERGRRLAVVSGLEAFAHGTRLYLVVATVFGFVVAVLDTVFLYFTPIPDPLLWGLLAFITNYIPNIGFVVGVIPPAVLGLLEGGPGLMLTVIVVYSLLNAVIQSVIQPRVVGETVGLSGTVTFVSLVFWAWVLGAVGALFAVPLTLLVKCLLIDVDGRASWVGPLLDGAPAAPPAAEDPAGREERGAGEEAGPGHGSGPAAGLPRPSPAR
jgi:predicted PurR-regulated permease PerM